MTPAVSGDDRVSATAGRRIRAGSVRVEMARRGAGAASEMIAGTTEEPIPIKAILFAILGRAVLRSLALLCVRSGFCALRHLNNFNSTPTGMRLYNAQGGR